MLEIYAFYIFDRRGTCMLYHEWAAAPGAERSATRPDPKLVFGLLFSLKQLAAKLSPQQAPSQGQGAAAQPAGPPAQASEALSELSPGNVNSFSTSNSALHQFETASGLRFVLVSGKCKEHLHKDVQAALRHVYAELFVNTLVKNPQYKPGELITNAAFTRQLDRYMIGVAKRFA
jgi:hypothetical protein